MKKTIIILTLSAVIATPLHEVEASSAVTDKQEIQTTEKVSQHKKYYYSKWRPFYKRPHHRPEVSIPGTSKPEVNVPEVNAPETSTPEADTPEVNGPTSNPQDEVASLSAIEQEILRLTNVEREKAGLKPLQSDQQLMASAREKSKDMATNNYFSHTSPTYGSPFDQMKQHGVTYRSAAENIAKGQRTATEVVKAWMESPGHRQNILTPQFTHIGIGFDQNGYVWTQQFIQK